MNGPEHYHKAERLLEQARDGANGQYGGFNNAAIAQAQAHATLALAAAVALADKSSADRGAWFNTVAVKGGV